MADEITVTIKNHLKSLLTESPLPDTDESLETLMDAWIKKETMFKSQCKSLNMKEVSEFHVNDGRGALIVTFSGSLLGIGGLKDGNRWIEYSSIKLRSDVPEIISADNARLSENLETGKPVEFSAGPISSTSPVFTIAVCPEDLSHDEQENRIREATLFLTNGFVKINRTVEIPENTPDHFTLQSMVKYIASKNRITQAAARQIINDYTGMIEAGLLLGERVHLGKLGTAYLNIRPPRKARVGRNPATGEEMTIKAKPAVPVPKFSFSSRLKDRSAQIPVAQIDDNYKEQ